MNLPSSDILKKMQGFHYGPALRPERDWLVLIGISLVLFAGSVIWNLWLFDRVVNGETIGTEAVPTRTRTVDLGPVNALFESRAQEEARYLNEYRFVDPAKVGS